VSAFAAALDAGGLDLLINNAAIERLGRASAARVVTLSSLEHKAGHIQFDDLQLEHGCAPRKGLPAVQTRQRGLRRRAGSPACARPLAFRFAQKTAAATSR
jgi:hypothetical protein